MKELTKDEINEGIHEAMGGCLHGKLAQVLHFRCKKCKEWAINPDYCTDLNAMAEVEAEIEEKMSSRADGRPTGTVRYVLAIRRKLGLNDRDLSSGEEAMMISASAETRARAAYEVLQAGGGR